MSAEKNHGKCFTNGASHLRVPRYYYRACLLSSLFETRGLTVFVTG